MRQIPTAPARSTRLTEHDDTDRGDADDSQRGPRSIDDPDGEVLQSQRHQIRKEAECYVSVPCRVINYRWRSKQRNGKPF